MEYKKASKIRKTGLLKLIAENKFKKGKSVTASIGGAVSDKFKAKATGIKESLDPLNLIRKMTGGGVIGKSIRTVAGRAMGRSEEDIEYFGGYANQRKKRKEKSRKDPLISSIGAGELSSVRIGDGAADILAKMYNFMQKNKEQEKLRYELDKAFRDEQLDEDERRHKKLIQSILERVNQTPQTQEPEDKESALDKFSSMLGKGIGAVLKGIIASVKFLGSMVTKILGILLPLATKLIGTIVKVIVDNAMSIFKLILPSLTTLIKGLIFGALRTALGTTTAIVASGFVAGNVVADWQNETDLIRGGSKAQQLQAEKAEAEAKMKELEGSKSTFGEKNWKETNRRHQQELAEYDKKIKEAIIEEEKNIVIPAMAKIGFEPKGNERDKKGLLIFKNKKNEIADTFDFQRALKGEDYLQKFINKEAFGEDLSFGELAKKTSTDLINSATSSATSAVNSLTAPLINQYNEGMKQHLPNMVDFEKLFVSPRSSQSSSSPENNFNIFNKTNTVAGAPPRVTTGDTAEVRNGDISNINDPNYLVGRGGQ